MEFQGNRHSVGLLKRAVNTCLRLPAVFGTALFLALIVGAVMAPHASAKNFSSLPDMSMTRYGHSMTLLQNGTVLIAGGFNNIDCLKTAEIYDPETGQNSPARDMKSARMDHTATLLANGKVLITGGRNGSAAVNSAEIYDPSTNNFKTTADNVAGRVGHSATLLPNGKVMIAGGTSNNKYVAAAEIYDPETGKITAASSLVVPRIGHTATLLPNGKVLIAGGMKDTAYVTLVEIFDPATGKFTAVTNMLTGRYSHTATLLEDGRLLVSGGRNGSGIIRSAEIFDPATWTTSPTEAMTTERDDHTSTLMPDGTVLIAGGRNTLGYLNTAELFYPETGSFVPTVNMTSIRDISNAILLASGKVLVAGGWDGASAACSAEIFDPEINQPKNRLHLNTVGKGDGSVNFTPGRSCSGSCSQFFPRGTTVKLTPVLDDNTAFVGWSGCDAVDGMDCTVTMWKNRHVKLRTDEIPDDDGKPDYAITATAGTNGSIAPPGVTMVDRGRNITYTITPNPGYHVADVVIDGRRDLGPITTFTFTKVKKNHTIAATFAPNNAVNITATAGPNGTISPDDIVLVPSGGSQSFTITPAAGFRVADVLVDGVSVGAVTSYDFNAITTDHTITATFTPIVFSITAGSGANGIIDPAGVVLANSGSDQAFTIAPASGFGIGDVLVDGISVGAVTSYRFSNVNGDHTISASFTPIIYTITASAAGNGAISPAGVSNVISGSNKDFAIIPAVGYRVADVLVDGVSVGAVTSYSFLHITANHTITASFTPIIYTITAAEGINGTVAPAGASSVTSGSNKDYTITPAAGYRVADVLVDGASVGAVNSYTFSNVTADHSISATFTPIVFAITATTGANGSITPAGVSSVNHGAALSYAITPAIGFKVADVLVDGVSVGALNSYSFANVTANHTISASFSQIVHVITVAACVNGSIDGPGAGSINYGTDLTCAITPAIGFRVADVLVDGVSIGAVNSYTFSSVTADHSISATFTPIVYEITASAGANGSISPAGVSSVNHGSAQVFTFTPAAGFRVADVLVDGVSVGAVTTYSFSDVAASHAIAASFTPIVYDITATPGANGSISPAGLSSVNHGSALTYTITPAVGFRVADVLVDGVSVGAVNSYAFANVTANHTISASFTLQVFAVSSGAGTNGSIMPAGESSINFGAGLNCTITPAPGFKIADVLVDGVSVGAVNSYAFTNVTADHTISASFTPIVYTITATTDANGSITPAGTSGVNHGAGLTYTVVPAADYQVADVLVDGVSVGAVTSYAFTNVTADHTITATFTPIIYAFNITASAGSNGSIAPLGVSSVNRGNSLTYTIVPATGYKVANVLVDGASVGAPTSYTFSNVLADHVISVSFVKAYTITASAGPNGSIDPVGVTTVASGSSMTYTITPAPGYKVQNIAVNGVYKGASTSYTFSNVTMNYTINATFSPITYSISASAGPNGSISPSGTATVNQGSSKSYTITPIPGYHVEDVQVDGSSVGAVSSYTFSNVTASHTISATFAANTPVTVTASAGPNGSISPAGDITLLSGSSQTFTFTPAAGYRVEGVLVDGVAKGALNSYTFTNIAGNHSISVSFTADVFTITAGAGPNGSIAPAGVTTLNRGDSITLVITPAPGYQVQNIVVDGVYKGASTSYTFSSVTASHTINVTFTPITYSITAVPGANGAITPAGSATVNQGTDKTYAISPTPGYRVADVLVDGVSVGAVTSYTFSNVTASHTISATFAANPSVTITASAGPNGSISPSGDITVLSGSNQAFTFTPAAGFRVGDVLVDGASVGAPASYTFSAISATNHTISVSFTADVFIITAGAGPNGSIDPVGATSVARGGSMTCTITPAPGYQVQNIAVDGVYKGAATSYSFSNVTANHTINATFTPITYSITSGAGANGSISPSGTATVNHGGSKSYTITPNPGYRVADVLVDGVSAGAVSSYTFSSVTASHTIDASFAANPSVTITASAGPNGSISPAGDITLLSGSSQTFTFNPAAGYRVGDVLVDGASVGAPASYTFSAISATNHTISVSFTADVFTITAGAGPNGSIDPAGVIVLSRGNGLTYTITPAPGYQVQNIAVDGVYKGAATSYTFSNVTANHTINATFTPITFSITASAGADGSISPSGTAIVASGSSKTFNITPAAGYHVNDVLVDGTSAGAVTAYTFDNVTANHSISATFAANPPVTVTASAGPNGSISPAGDIALLSGVNQTFTFTPAVGYRVSDVTVDNVSVGTADSYTLANITENHSVSVSFTLDVFTISATAGSNGSIDPAGVTTLNRGDSITYTITPAPGYRVLNVAVDGVYKGAVTSYSFDNVTANHTIIPTFALIQ